MKAIFEVTFNVKESNSREKVSDTRRIVGTADTGGFMKAAAWAKDRCDSSEFVAGIRMLACEHH